MLYGGGGVADMFTVYGIRLCGPSCSSRVRGNFLQMVLTKTGCNDWVGSYVIYSEGARKSRKEGCNRKGSNYVLYSER